MHIYSLIYLAPRRPYYRSPIKRSFLFCVVRLAMCMAALTWLFVPAWRVFEVLC